MNCDRGNRPWSAVLLRTVVNGNHGHDRKSHTTVLNLVMAQHMRVTRFTSMLWKLLIFASLN